MEKLCNMINTKSTLPYLTFQENYAETEPSSASPKAVMVHKPTNHDADEGDDEDKDVATHRIIVGTSAFGEHEDARVQFVLCKCLQDPWGTNQGSNGRGESGGKAPSIDQRSPG